MNQSILSRTAADLIYLVSCAVDEITPDARRCAEMDDEKVYALAKQHMLSAAAACALEKVMPLPNHWLSAKGNSKRRLIIFQAERARIFREFDERGIRYLPLKGIILKDLYPKPEMREMSDNDILCDVTQMDEIKEIMLSMGYTCKHFGGHEHDVYNKSTASFEMHRTLFNSIEHPEEHSYYQTISERIIKDDGNTCGYHMTDDDFYVYCINHMYKHFTKGGTGLRSLLDIYLINKKKGGALNLDYIGGELDNFGLRDFEIKARELALKTFSLQPLTDSEQAQLAFYVNSGTYGTTNHLVLSKFKNDKSKKARRRYILRRIFPDEDYLNLYEPVVYRHRILYPFLVIYRPFRALVKKRTKVASEIKTLREIKVADNDASDK